MSRRIGPAFAVPALAALMITLGACGGSSSDSTSTSSSSTPAAASTSTPAAAADTTAADTTASAASGPASKCGLGNGQKATGTPIKIGAIVTKQPGTDFTDGTNMQAAYFKCVNDNGGINGRPIQLIAETEQSDPGQVANLGKKLIESDGVVAIVGSFSLLECAVNGKYYQSKGFNEIDAGIAPECYGTPNSAAVNMGPRYSSDGAVQYLLKQGVKKIAFDQSNVPGTGYIEGGPIALAKAAGVEITSLKDNVPIQDANSIAQKLVQAAGDGGGVVLNFTPPEALKILQAAEQQGLAKRVKWGCSTPCNTDFLADALGSSWDGQLFVNAELQVLSAQGPDMQLYNQVLKQYGSKIPVGSFSQMGFLMGKIITDRLMTIKGDITPETANAAIKATKDFKNDILCKPWYYGGGALHIPNNTDRTVTPKDGKMVLQEDCTPISADDPDIAKVRAIEKEEGIS
jgi:branched-chain amino acid transport system substrate-binding protein